MAKDKEPDLIGLFTAATADDLAKLRTRIADQEAELADVAAAYRKEIDGLRAVERALERTCSGVGCAPSAPRHLTGGGMAKRPRGLKAVLWARATAAAGVTVPCRWCGKPMAYAEATCDHEPALAEGGRSRQAVLACDGCNQERGKATNARLRARGRKKGRRNRRGR